MNKIIKIHAADNAIVALTDLYPNEVVTVGDENITITEVIAAKHKFALTDLNTGDSIYMYGVLVGKATANIKKGGLLSTANIAHASSTFSIGERKLDWHKPDVSAWESRTFNGYHRADGSVGTANYWLVIPMVFCENRMLRYCSKLWLMNWVTAKAMPTATRPKPLLTCTNAAAP